MRWGPEPLSPALQRLDRALRWLAEKIKQNIGARTNAAYGIADRQHVTNESKAQDLAADGGVRI